MTKLEATPHWIIIHIAKEPQWQIFRSIPQHSEPTQNIQLMAYSRN